MAQPVLNSAPLKVLVFGAGAIATYIGGSLALAGHSLTFVARPKTAAELRERGLRLDLTLDKRRKTQDAFLISPQSFVTATSLEDALRYGPFDLVLYALKSYDTPAAIEEMHPFAQKLPPVLCLSNGVENESMLAAALGAEKVIYGTVTTAVAKRAAGDIVLEKLRGVGLASGHPFSKRLVTIMDAAFLNCRLFPDPAGMKWSKMLTNLIANPTAAILNMSAAEVFSDARLYKMEIDMLRECLAVMKALDLKVFDLPGTPVRALAFATKLPYWLSRPLVARAAGSGRGNKMPSFHIDLHSGRGKSEVGYLHGAVANHGREKKVPTPVNQFLASTLTRLVNGETPLDEYDHQPEKLIQQLYA